MNNKLTNRVRALKSTSGLLIPGSPRFSVLQATESWAGPGNEARTEPLSNLRAIAKKAKLC